ncbi:MAG TPA: hypothetical protein ENG14_02365 [Thermodesulforhabdus norvegica]|uniref:Uncharacterized protein n=1 Tax=Thermodesulforhabdus norvegica TaxID=39841 RepID=A0A7C0WUI4_9BACT|nr:hypothetical protein [Thermodesulforhabdus norvegica]
MRPQFYRIEIVNDDKLIEEKLLCIENIITIGKSECGNTLITMKDKSSLESFCKYSDTLQYLKRIYEDSGYVI